MKSSLALNILRISLFLVFIGLLLPISCNSNGYQMAQGILGNTEQAKNASFLSSVEDIYGYLMFGVFVFALIGLIITFLKNVNNNFYLGFACLIISFILILIIGNRLKIHFNFKEFKVYIIAGGIPIIVKLLIGWYSMIIGYILGTIGFILKILKKIN
ncbi:MAG: hypothetical protein JXB50_14015 [Spirochaetes bacterium]|nr:hypothetical protein [Spirochaetota bacterium]